MRSGFGGHVGAAEVLLKAKADPNVRAEARLRRTAICGDFYGIFRRDFYGEALGSHMQWMNVNDIFRTGDGHTTIIAASIEYE